MFGRSAAEHVNKFEPFTFPLPTNCFFCVSGFWHGCTNEVEAMGDLDHILDLDNETICIKFEKEFDGGEFR